MKCEKCKFFKPVTCPDCDPVRVILGECRRFPPIQDGKGVHTVDEFPTIRLDYWCGEYKRGAKK